MVAPTKNAAEQYVADVLAGKIVVGKLVRLAVERHVRDLERSKDEDYPYRFDPEAGNRAIRFFGILKHSKGEWAGQSFQLSGWQAFIQWCGYGWKRKKDGYRRFRIIYIEVARKNGKSTYAAGNGIYLLVADNEAGGEVYTAATKRDQARIVHGEAIRMVRASPALKKHVGVVRDNIHVKETSSKFEPLGQDSNTEDGLNPHAAIIDEYHAHKDRGMYDVLDTATGSRRQPLFFIITTAGDDDLSPCKDMHDHAAKVLEGKDDYTDDELFAFIACMDEGDDPFEEKNWIKANPNLGISVITENFAAKAKTAQQMPSARNAFLQKRLNVWVQTAVAWLDVAKWDACKREFDPGEWAGAEQFGGFDLASKIDLTAFVRLLKKDGRYYLIPRFWIPKDTARRREKYDRIPYGQWIDDGLIIATSGNVTDYDQVEGEIAQECSDNSVINVGYDPHNAAQIAQHLQDRHGVRVIDYAQGFAHMNEPCREWERLIEAGLISHNGNAVMRWMIGNVSIKTNQVTNEIRPVKPEDRSTKKIDGVVAALMATGVSMSQTEELLDVR